MTIVKDKIQLAVFIPPEGKSFEEMKKLCQTAEKLGFHAFLITDHFMNMANPKGRENHPLECWTTLAGLAAVTSRIVLGPLVSCIHCRHPTVLAKMATTVDIISNGRLIFGIGAGWHREEFEGFLGRFPSVKERLDGLEDAAIICKSMFQNEYTTYKGKIYSANNTLNSPRPVRGYIPIMIGGSGEKRLLKIAAKYADIIHIAGFPLIPMLEHKINVIKKHCSNIGRNYEELILATGIRIIVRENEEKIIGEAKALASRANLNMKEAEKIVKSKFTGPKNITETLKEYHKRGVDLFTMPRLTIEDMKILAEEALPKLKE